MGSAASGAAEEVDVFDAADPTAARQVDADDIPPPPPPGPPPLPDAPAAPASDHALVLDTKGLRISADPGQTTDVLERHAVEALEVGAEFGGRFGGRLWARRTSVAVGVPLVNGNMLPRRPAATHPSLTPLAHNPL